MSAWIDAMRDRTILEVASVLGLPAKESRGASPGSVFGCPACGAERRHSKSRDRRGALGITPGGRGWRCMQCDAAGDAIDLVAYHLRDKRFRDLDDTSKVTVREWCEGWTHTEAPTRLPEPMLPVTPAYPPADELASILASAGRVDEDAEAATYLGGRGVSAARVADLELAFALSTSGALPGWARMQGSPWRETGHRILVPLYDAKGALQSVIARSIHRDAERKSTPPVGFSRSGLVMACAFARGLLVATKRPEWWPSTRRIEVVITEGEIDWLLWATAAGDADEFAPAVFGVVAGSWTLEHAHRLPRDVHAIIATDDDDEGDKYADKIVASFDPARALVTRHRYEANA